MADKVIGISIGTARSRRMLIGYILISTMRDVTVPS